ncbi:hypothetical protein BDD12DRAFT_887762 [Trichophaea hybrida]|nr:hypothetical protein BDD12DRAFT_887762 [Trichophaea hybrida]
MHFSKLLLAASAVVIVSAAPAGDSSDIECPTNKPYQYCCNGDEGVSLSCNEIPIIGAVVSDSQCNQVTHCCNNKANQGGNGIVLNINALNCLDLNTL